MATLDRWQRAAIFIGVLSAIGLFLWNGLDDNRPIFEGLVASLEPGPGQDGLRVWRLQMAVFPLVVQPLFAGLAAWSLVLAIRWVAKGGQPKANSESDAAP